MSSSSIACASRAGSIVAVDVRHRFVAKRADHVDERVGVLVRGDVDERLRAAAACGEIGELHRGGHALPRVEHRRQTIQPHVRHFGHADLHLAAAVAARPGSRTAVMS